MSKGEEIGMVNGIVPWSETKDPLACNTDDPVNFIEVSRDPVRTPFQWRNEKNGGTFITIFVHSWDETYVLLLVHLQASKCKIIRSQNAKKVSDSYSCFLESILLQHGKRKFIFLKNTHKTVPLLID